VSGIVQRSSGHAAAQPEFSRLGFVICCRPGEQDDRRRKQVLVIAGTIRIDSANEAKAIEAAVEMMTETHKEEGCISYVFSRDLVEAGAFRIFEEWQSQEALDLHFAAPHMAKFQKILGGIGIKEMAVKKYEIASVGNLGG
jgi:quinol monooxygenase YgiN